jgi:hypothetical protein
VELHGVSAAAGGESDGGVAGLVRVVDALVVAHRVRTPAPRAVVKPLPLVPLALQRGKYLVYGYGSSSMSLAMGEMWAFLCTILYGYSVC